MTILERATNYAEERCGRLDYATGQLAYKQGATDQDPISRADERKKVIDKVCDYLRENCYDHYDAPWIVEKGIHHFLEYMKKAKEE